jgi:predicted O-methyltransferase YrrM
MHLDSFAPLQSRVGYGQLGTGGSLGYESKRVIVRGRSYAHAISAHPPSRILYQLGGRFSSFRCEVAINDDVAGTDTHADFVVLADGVRAGTVAHLRPGQDPRPLGANVWGAQCLELIVETSRWEFCHAVWLDPRVESRLAEPAPSLLLDCLHRAEISLPLKRPRAGRCIATVVSPGYEALADDMLGSLFANGECQDALLVMFMLGHSAACVRLAAKYKALLVPARARAAVNPMSKALLYSLVKVADAEQYLCLDADMLVLGSLRPVFMALEACPEGSILAVREANGTGRETVRDAFLQVYGGSEAELSRMASADDVAYPLVVNDGLFAGDKAAMHALDSTIRAIPGAVSWIDARRDMWWRNQFIFNLALARLRCGVELDGRFNVQLHAQDVALRRAPCGIEAEWRGRPVRVLHLSGAGRRKHPEWRGVYSSVLDPLAAQAAPDAYRAFLRALRGWIGRFGVSALAWSFYGTADAKDARIHDPGAFPLLALLHYLVRANGCTRVLETGTARGVSAACLASAVAHRAEPLVVTFDPYPHGEAYELWAALPASMRNCVELRVTDSLAGMDAAIAAGERYDAALLDSVHTAEHVWAEFDRARRLVCSGGLILIHDACYRGGTVATALARIEDAGFGVTRLWMAESGIAEDDGLGLAVIANHHRPRRESGR